EETPALHASIVAPMRGPFAPGRGRTDTRAPHLRCRVVRTCRSAYDRRGGLEIARVDLAGLALGLGDHSPDHVWLLGPVAGGVGPGCGGPPEDRDGAVAVDPLPATVGYGDMEDFVAYVRDVHARDLLERALVGRGAFRRFKDAIAAFPELRRAWFAFHDARGE